MDENENPMGENEDPRTSSDDDAKALTDFVDWLEVNRPHVAHIEAYADIEIHGAFGKSHNHRQGQGKIHGQFQSWKRVWQGRQGQEQGLGWQGQQGRRLLGGASPQGVAA